MSPQPIENKMVNGVNNPGIELDLEWIGGVSCNLPAINRRAATLGTRRTVKKQWQAAWLCRYTCYVNDWLTNSKVIDNNNELSSFSVEL